MNCWGLGLGPFDKKEIFLFTCFLAAHRLFFSSSSHDEVSFFGLGLWVERRGSHYHNNNINTDCGKLDSPRSFFFYFLFFLLQLLVGLLLGRGFMGILVPYMEPIAHTTSTACDVCMFGSRHYYPSLLVGVLESLKTAFLLAFAGGLDG